MLREDIKDILNNSKVLTVAGFKHYDSQDGFYFFREDALANPGVFKTNLLMFSNKFVLNSIINRKDFSFEHVNDETNVISVLNYRQEEKSFEILEHNESLSININGENYHLLFSVSSDNISFYLKNKDKTFKFIYDKDNNIYYNEKADENNSISLKLKHLNNYQRLSCNNEEYEFKKSSKIYKNILSNETVKSAISTMLDDLSSNLPGLMDTIKQYKIYEKLVVKNNYSSCFNRNFINSLINNSKIKKKSLL